MEEKVTNYLNRVFGVEAYKVYQLAGDASSRKYYRALHNQQSYVIMSWEPFDPITYPFLSVQKHFANHNIKVPEVIDQNAEEGFLILEDLGDLTLERKFWENQSPESSIPFYHMALEELRKIHFLSSKTVNDCVAFKVQFDVEKLLWEMNYGKDNLIKKLCEFQLSESAEKEIDQIFLNICERLHKEPKFIAHRDYHSRNLMIKFDEMRVIDFQDARLGSIQYDLVSLLRDSYVNIPENMENELINHYLDISKEFLGPYFSKEHFDVIYELQSIQRCFKACGSFSSFYNQRQDRRYLKYISGTLKRVMKSINDFPEYSAFSNILIDAGALERKYESL